MYILRLQHLARQGQPQTLQVFLLSRIRERYEVHGDNKLAVAEGLSSSARTISSAATGLSLSIRAGWLRWLTVAGAVVPTPLALAEQAKHRAEQAEQLMAMYRRRCGDLGGRREQEQ